MNTDEFDYELPESAIAARCGAAGIRRGYLSIGAIDSMIAVVADLPELLRADDVLVVNDTRVLPARVRFTRPTGGSGEVLLLEARADGWWEALVRPSAKVAAGITVPVDERFSFEFGDDLGEGQRLVRPLLDGEAPSGADLFRALDRVGEMPLPPYLGHVTLDDPDRYQTVFAERPASAAAPTAGLHLTEALLDRIAAAGVEVARVELVVGLGTFKPMTTDRVEDHVMHRERYRIDPVTWASVTSGRRVVAVGTTVVRALESAAASGELTGSTDLFITRGHDWRVVDALMTNFHLPRSTLLVMIDAFVGPRWREIYATALDRRYRFLSFGDAMLLERADLSEGSG